MQLYLDLDGVLADFDGAFERRTGKHPIAYEADHGTDAIWRVLNDTPGFFAGLDVLPDALDLLDATAHLAPIVLTGVPRQPSIADPSAAAAAQKREWLLNRLPAPHSAISVIACYPSKKSAYCTSGDILVDDRSKYADRWRDAGGIFILHHSAAHSIAALRALGVL